MRNAITAENNVESMSHATAAVWILGGCVPSLHEGCPVRLLSQVCAWETGTVVGFDSADADLVTVITASIKEGKHTTTARTIHRSSLEPTLGLVRISLLRSLLPDLLALMQRCMSRDFDEKSAEAGLPLVRMRARKAIGKLLWDMLSHNLYGPEIAVLLLREPLLFCEMMRDAATLCKLESPYFHLFSSMQLDEALQRIKPVVLHLMGLSPVRRRVELDRRRSLLPEKDDTVSKAEASAKKKKKKKKKLTPAQEKIVADMVGFLGPGSERRCRVAFEKSGCDSLERAVQWAFEHSFELNALVAADAADDTEPAWEWFCAYQNRFRPFAPKMSADIEAARAAGQGYFRFTRAGKTYVVDFRGNFELCMETGQKRDVRRVGADSDDEEDEDEFLTTIPKVEEMPDRMLTQTREHAAYYGARHFSFSEVAHPPATRHHVTNTNRGTNRPLTLAERQRQVLWVRRHVLDGPGVAPLLRMRDGEYVDSDPTLTADNMLRNILATTKVDAGPEELQRFLRRAEAAIATTHLRLCVWLLLGRVGQLCPSGPESIGKLITAKEFDISALIHEANLNHPITVMAPDCWWCFDYLKLTFHRSGERRTLPDSQWLDGVRGMLVAGCGPLLKMFLVQQVNRAACLSRLARVRWGDSSRLRSCCESAAMNDPNIEMMLDLTAAFLELRRADLLFSEIRDQYETIVDFRVFDALMRGLRSANTTLKEAVLRVLTWLVSWGAFPPGSRQRQRLPTDRLFKLLCQLDERDLPLDVAAWPRDKRKCELCLFAAVPPGPPVYSVYEQRLFEFLVTIGTPPPNPRVAPSMKPQQEKPSAGRLPDVAPQCRAPTLRFSRADSSTKHLRFSKNDCCVTYSGGSGRKGPWQIAMVDIELTGSGVVHLEMVIDSCTPYNLQNQNDNYIFIGVAPRKACLKAMQEEGVPHRNWAMGCSNCLLVDRHRENGHDNCPLLVPGLRLGLHLDTRTHELSFYGNGQDYGIAHTGVKADDDDRLCVVAIISHECCGLTLLPNSAVFLQRPSLSAIVEHMSLAGATAWYLSESVSYLPPELVVQASFRVWQSWSRGSWTVRATASGIPVLVSCEPTLCTAFNVRLFQRVLWKKRSARVVGVAFGDSTKGSGMLVLLTDNQSTVDLLSLEQFEGEFASGTLTLKTSEVDMSANRSLVACDDVKRQT